MLLTKQALTPRGGHDNLNERRTSMTDYGKGLNIAGASVLPATSAAGIFFADKLNPVIITGFIILNVVWLVILSGQISRFLLNRASK